MSRPFVFPDPNDRFPNNPSIVVSPTQVLGIYKKYTKEKMDKVTTEVPEWFFNKAKEYQWDNADFSGNQCILKVNLLKKEMPED